jgi:hypothetical protein
VLERSTPVDSFQLFDHCNLTNIDSDMSILDSMIATQFRGRIPVRHEKCNNSTTTDPFQSVRSELKRSTSVDTRRVVDHQNPTSIGKDTIICVSSKISQVQHDTMGTVLRYLFLPTELLWDAGTRPSSALLQYCWYPSTLL